MRMMGGLTEKKLKFAFWLSISCTLGCHDSRAFKRLKSYTGYKTQDTRNDGEKVVGAGSGCQKEISLCPAHSGGAFYYYYN